MAPPTKCVSRVRKVNNEKPGGQFSDQTKLLFLLLIEDGLERVLLFALTITEIINVNFHTEESKTNIMLN